MVTTFNKGDLRSFYYYMISDRRREYLTKHPELGDTNIEVRLSKVNTGDIELWMKWELEKKRGK